MKKKIVSFILIIILAGLFTLSISYQREHQFLIKKEGKFTVLLNNKIGAQKNQPEEKDLTPLLFNFLSKLIYKFAQ